MKELRTHVMSLGTRLKSEADHTVAQLRSVTQSPGDALLPSVLLPSLPFFAFHYWMGRPRQAILDAAHARARAREESEEGGRWAALGQGALMALACCLLLGVAYLQSFPLSVYLTGVRRANLAGEAYAERQKAEDWRALPVGTVRWWTCGGVPPPGVPKAQCGFVMCACVPASERWRKG
ncbi:hypothetical protein CALVIDRAFT_237257 [Calocera viscosa TUFC12733]|uniref:Uncharacterized protein n=1 Tax=Calocera viscosa (strain TUFC12733) TaxID=1330018 RepID=A0A167JUJ7_CALVF|nr:hypothetical protein CALVIDRAFT_237257 [Calocera viscosa TUFC12733]